MRCAWNEVIRILPDHMREAVNRLGKDRLQELRLRIGYPPELVMKDGNIRLSGIVARTDLQFCVNSASRYSPWAAATIRDGYITAPGGHRIGLCGETIIQGENVTGIRDPTSICIRVARDFPGISKGADNGSDSILIIGSPGFGKTTLLRDLVRQRSEQGICSIAVVDERGELFPEIGCFPSGSRTDVLTGCKKSLGIEMVLRTMGPGCIAVDEITAEEDCNALQHAGWCGVSLLATAHAANMRDLKSRPVYQALLQAHLFDRVIILQQDKSWTVERMER